MGNASIADRAVSAIAAVAQMDAGLDNEHAERHTVRTLKRLAEALLMDASMRAQELAYLAEQMRADGAAARAAMKGS